MKRIYIALIASLFLGTGMSYAQTLPPETARSSNCVGTPAVGAIAYPGAARIPTTNSLIRPEGKADNAQGQVLYFTGKVLDTNCNPLQDVKIEMWQPDPFSKLEVATPEDLSTPQSLFSGAGKTYTKNDGTFSFSTLFPGTLRYCIRYDERRRCLQSIERAPFLNLRLSGKDLRAPFILGVFFENDRRNATDPVFKKLSSENQKRLTMRVFPYDGVSFANGMKTYIELVMPSGNQTHGY